MFSYQGLFLMVLIFSSARILYADILVPNGNQNSSNSNLNHSQYKPIPQNQATPQPVQFPRQDLADQKWMQYPYYTTYHYYGIYDDQPHLNLVGYPLFRHHHYHRYPSYHSHYYHPHHRHYAKIGGHGYTRPSVFVHYPNPLVVHHRYTRSAKSEPTSIKASKSTVIKNDDDVATESPVSETKRPKVIDSMLPETEPTDTNNKRVNRQSKNDHVITKPLLFGLYPEKMYHGHRQIGESSIDKESTSEHRNEQSPKTPANVKLAHQINVSERDQEISDIDPKILHFSSNEPTEKMKQSSSPVSSTFKRSSERELPSHLFYNYYDNYNNIYRNAMANPWLMMPIQFPRTEAYETSYVPVQQGVTQEFNKEYSQKSTDVDTIDKGTSNIEKIAVHIPCPNCESTSEPIHEPTIINNTPLGEDTTTPVPCVTCTYKNNEELLGTNQRIDSSYSNGIYTLPPMQFPQVSYDNTDYDWKHSDEYSSSEDLNEYMDNGFTGSNLNNYINPAYSTPISSIKISDYVLNANPSARSNPALIPMQSVTPQYFSTYNYPNSGTYNPQLYNYYYDQTYAAYRSVPFYIYSSPVYY